VRASCLDDGELESRAEMDVLCAGSLGEQIRPRSFKIISSEEDPLSLMYSVKEQGVRSAE